jgi:hypothetical protein
MLFKLLYAVVKLGITVVATGNLQVNLARARDNNNVLLFLRFVSSFRHIFNLNTKRFALGIVEI